MNVRRLVVLGMLAVALAGCELELTASAEVRRDGRGTATLDLRLDRELVAELAELAVDPTAELEAAVAAADGWSVARRTDGDGGLRVTVSRPTTSAQDLTDALGDLSAGLSPDDPALLLDLDVALSEDGAADLRGTVGVRPPAGPGSLGDPEAPDADALAALVAETVTAELVVTLPGEAVEHDADRADGRTLRWDVPVGEERDVSARAAAPTGPALELVVAAAAAGLVLASATIVTVLAVRRRRRRTDGSQQRM